MADQKVKNVIIKGCSSGLGLHTARGLQARGYRVFASARDPQDVARLQQEGLEALQLDLDDSSSIATAVEQLLARTDGKIYALFNNGAYGQPGAVEDLTTEVLRAQFETNLFGWHELTRRILPLMRKQGEGRIIQNSSVLGFVPMAFRGAYNASKYALEGLSDTLRLELHGSNIFVSLIEPGPITSNFRKNAYLKWQQNIDSDNSIHRNHYRAMEKRLTKDGPAVPFTLPPEAVLKRVIHALESKRPKAYYCVTFPTYLFAFLRRVLPARALDAVLRKASSA
jgi:NAD(P)-dependent dehydrogenase (short-subunit alcohol dehydrogenase family)